jgi:hypothetical protein
MESPHNPHVRKRVLLPSTSLDFSVLTFWLLTLALGFCSRSLPQGLTSRRLWSWDLPVCFISGTSPY